MSNIHAPTIPSGPTSASATNGHAGNLTFAELQRKKDDVEAELKALGSVLDSHGVTMETSLLTRDGFPRADIDVAQIRTTRARIIRLRNDYKELMTTIEKHLHEFFAESKETELSALPANGINILSSQADTRALEPAFARVNSVAAGSPAETAGLKAGDEIRNFGYVNHGNHDNMRKVAECVQGNEGSNVLVRVSRPSGVTTRQELRLTLTPRKDWGGRGMLGCHILPL